MGSRSLVNLLTADTAYLQSHLQKGTINSSFLVDAYLAQINKHDQYLHAMIQLAPQPLFRSTAESLDLERKEGKLRGPLHGIQIVIKDNIATHPDLGLRASAGSLALFDSKPPRNAKIVDRLIRAGVIILGKANLSEPSNYRGNMLPSGWSAVGGQTQSAYVRVLDAISGADNENSFVSSLTNSWENIGVATLDPEVWNFPDSYLKPVPEATEQILRDIRAAYDKIQPSARTFAENVPLRTRDGVFVEGEDLEMVITRADLKSTLNDYLEQLDYSTVRDLQELIQFNKDHAEQELPPRHDNQNFLVQTQAQNISAQHYSTELDFMHSLFRENGVDTVMKKYNVDVIIGPSYLQSQLSLATLLRRRHSPTWISTDGRLASLYWLVLVKTPVLVQALSAWETTFGPRKPPPLLEESE